MAHSRENMKVILLFNKDLDDYTLTFNPSLHSSTFLDV